MTQADEKKHKNTAKTIENRTWRHLAAFQARFDALLDRCFSFSFALFCSVCVLNETLNSNPKWNPKWNPKETLNDTPNETLK